MKAFQIFLTAVSLLFAGDVLVAEAAPEASPQFQTNIMPLTLNDVLRMMLEPRRSRPGQGGRPTHEQEGFTEP